MPRESTFDGDEDERRHHERQGGGYDERKCERQAITAEKLEIVDHAHSRRHEKKRQVLQESRCRPAKLRFRYALCSDGVPQALIREAEKEQHQADHRSRNGKTQAPSSGFAGKLAQKEDRNRLDHAPTVGRFPPAAQRPDFLSNV